MLRDLHVENLAVISQASIQLVPGFNVLTGETGAGKSMFVDALALLSGVRASTDLIRTGANDLTVTGIFEPGGDRWRSNLDEAGIKTEGDEIVVRREISREGRNRVFLNDRPVSLALLTSISGSLIRIHTQREELDLVSPEVQRSWLDRVGGVDGSSLHDKVGGLFEIYQHLEARLQRTQGDDRARAERADLLRFQIEEIDAAGLRENEDIDLEQERDSLRHAEAIHQALGAVFTRIFENEGSAIEQISLSTRELRKIEAWESLAPTWMERLTQVQVQLEDVTGEVRSRVDAVAADPKRLDVVEDRLATIDRLRRKYGDSVRGVLDYRARIETELEEVVTDVQQKEMLAERVEEAFEEYRQAAQRLSTARRRWAAELAERVQSQLPSLALAEARFDVELSTRRREDSRLIIDNEPVAFGSEGFDRVVFRLCANPGEELLPLAKSASGGELSRIYLAVQLASRGSGPAVNPTLVFDEVDAGIGGAVAAALGEKLALLAKGGQILVVSHLPQVASSADVHFRVTKRAQSGRTRTRIDRLSEAERVEEVARMLGGKSVTSLSISHAEEMIDSSTGSDK